MRKTIVLTVVALLLAQQLRAADWGVVDGLNAVATYQQGLYFNFLCEPGAKVLENKWTVRLQDVANGIKGNDVNLLFDGEDTKKGVHKLTDRGVFIDRLFATSMIGDFKVSNRLTVRYHDKLGLKHGITISLIGFSAAITEIEQRCRNKIGP